MEHLQELRYRVIMASAIGVVFGLAISAFFGEDIIEFLKEPGEEAQPDFQLAFLEPFENFVTYFRVSLLGGLILGMPVIVYQVLRFIAPGLQPERTQVAVWDRRSARRCCSSPASRSRTMSRCRLRWTSC